MSAPKLWIVVPRWDEFQHYKNRDPKWIKSYIRLLGDWNYLRLTLRLRGLLHGIWLLYAETGLELGASPAQIGRMIGDDSVRMRDLESLNRAGFIILSASRPLAARYQDASLEVEKEREEEKGTSSVDVTQGLKEARPPTQEDQNGTARDIQSIGEIIDASLGSVAP